MSKWRNALISVAALAFVGGACASGSDSEPPLTPTDLDELGTPPRESVPDAGNPETPLDGSLRPGLQVTSVDFDIGVAVLTNTGERDIDLTGYWICNRPNYAELPSALLVPGDSVEVSLGGFPASGGEVAVYTSNSFSDPNEIVSYVGWGTGGGRQAIAEDAGIWAGEPVPPTSASIELTGAPGSAAGWS